MSNKDLSRGYKDLLQYKDYLFVLVSSTLSIFGFILFQVVLYWLAYDLSNSTFEAAVIVQSSAIPYLLFGLVGGVYADKWNKKKVIIFNQLGTAFMILTILIMYGLDMESIWYIAFASFLIVSFRCFYSPAIRSLISKTLPEDLWAKGNSLFQISLQLSRSLAPVLSGLLLATISLQWTFVIFLVLTILPLFFIIPLTIEHKAGAGRVKVLQELKGTFSFLQTKRPLLFSIISFGFVLLFYTGLERLGLPIISDNEWEMGAKGFSIMLTLFGVGSALGAIVLGKIEIKGNYSRFIMIGCILWGFGLMGVGLSPNIFLASAFALFTGMMEAFIDLPMILMIQKYTPEEKIGKVFSILSTVAFIGEAGSSMLIAVFIEQAGIYASFIIVAILILLLCCITLLYTERKENQKISPLSMD